MILPPWPGPLSLKRWIQRPEEGTWWPQTQAARSSGGTPCTHLFEPAFRAAAVLTNPGDPAPASVQVSSLPKDAGPVGQPGSWVGSETGAQCQLFQSLGGAGEAACWGFRVSICETGASGARKGAGSRRRRQASAPGPEGAPRAAFLLRASSSREAPRVVSLGDAGSGARRCSAPRAGPGAAGPCLHGSAAGLASRAQRLGRRVRRARAIDRSGRPGRARPE